LLNIELEQGIIDRLSFESVYSPQLMQSLCLYYCWKNGINSKLGNNRKYALQEDVLVSVFENLSPAYSCEPFNTALLANSIDALTSPTNYLLLTSGKSVDIYRLILKSISLGQPKLLLPFSDIMKNIRAISENKPDEETVMNALNVLNQIAVRISSAYSYFEWDIQKRILAISEPYYLFFLRWGKWF
jgi:hypothetical protein